jgi:hypothetical protein
LCPFETHGDGGVLRETLLLFYSGAVGFVASGIAASFYKMVTSEPAKFGPLGEGFLAAFTTFFFCGLTGPFIIVDQAIRLRRKERQPFRRLLAAIGLAGLWSCCSGVIVLELVLSLKESLA